MDSNETARPRLLGGGAGPRPYAGLTTTRNYPPIYAQLVAEWTARGRVVPAGRDTSPDEGATWSATSWTMGRCTPPLPSPDHEAPQEREEYGEQAPLVPAVIIPRGRLGG